MTDGNGLSFIETEGVTVAKRGRIRVGHFYHAGDHVEGICYLFGSHGIFHTDQQARDWLTLQVNTFVDEFNAEDDSKVPSETRASVV